MNWAGSTVVITGAGSGIGRATALAVAERGARVVCLDIDAAAAEKVAAECEERGAASAEAHGVDVASREAMAAVAAEVGDVDVLVNNAGVGMSGRFGDMSLDDWTWIRNVNLDGVVHGCHAFGPAIVARGRGHVVNVSSALGFTPTATEIAYVTTKAGVLAFTQCLRADWKRHGIGVTAICPGVINTPIVDSTRYVGERDDPVQRAKVKRVFRRGHKPELVARAIVRAVERNSAVVPVGVEAKLAWLLHRYAPLAVQQRIASKGLS